MNKLSIFALLLLLISSCSRESKEDQADETPNIEYYLETLDSVKIADILAVKFLFQSADEDNLILKDAVSSTVYVFDRLGNPIDTWSKTGDVPGAFSMASGNIAQDKSGNLVLLDLMNGLKVFKKDGEIIQNFGLYHSQYSLGGLLANFKSYQIIQRDDQEYLLYSLDIIEDSSDDFGPSFFQERKNLLMTNLETDETEVFLPFPEGSQFLNGNVFYFGDFRPVFTYVEKEELLYVAFRNEPVLYVYDWHDEKPVLKEHIALELEGFEANSGFEKGLVSFGKISDNKVNPFPSQIISVEKYGKDFLISYKPTPADKGDLNLYKSGEASQELIGKLFEQAKTKTVVLTEGGTIVPLELPEMDSDSFRVIGDDIWWIKKHEGEEEQEDFILCRSRLVSK